MRPPSIVNFERVVLLIVLLSVVSAVIGWDETMAGLGARANESAMVAALVVLLGAILFLAWLIVRRGSNIARWIYVVLTVLMIAVAAPSLPRIFSADLVTIALNLAYLGLALLSLVLLFRPDARTWFDSRVVARG
jgi:hypothetical protein